MHRNEDYVEASSCECGNGVGVKVLIHLPKSRPVTLTEKMMDKIRHVGYKLYEDVMADIENNDPDEIKARAEEIEKLTALFDGPIFVEHTPNEYTSQWYARTWLIVTTKVGRIKIGWRKRVINIDWSDSAVKHEAEELFAGEDVTKGNYYIHAWGYEKAKEYLKKIVA